MKTFVILSLLILSQSLWATSNNIAVVKLLRGEADILTIGKTSPLKVDDWIAEGSVIKTSEKSFVRIVFTDKSQMNIGPNSELKIEKFNNQEAGVIDLVKGKIRSQVTKDYLQIKDKETSKLFIKTPNAVMGVRGTDFLISTNGKNTSTILFEGEIVFNHLKDKNLINTERLESVVNQGVKIYPGEFSVVDHQRNQPTMPATLNVQQIEVLEKNETFDQRAPSNAEVESDTKKSVVPQGLSAATVANDSTVLKEEVSQIAGVKTEDRKKSTSTDVNGFVKGNNVKPANGSVLHIDSGVIIPPSETSVLDKNTNSYSLSAEVTIDPSGDVKLKDKEITSDGQILATVVNQAGQKEVVIVSPPAPTVQENASTSAMIVNTPVGNQDVVLNPNGLGTVSQATSSGGGVQTVNEAAQHFGGGTSRVRTINTH